MDRRQSLRGMLSLAAAGVAGCNTAPTVTSGEIPPQGIGHRIKHISYSDQGGRPDAVQVMVNKRTVYVGHMFSNGITALDASDPRNLKPLRDVLEDAGYDVRVARTTEDGITMADSEPPDLVPEVDGRASPRRGRGGRRDRRRRGHP